MGLVSDEETTPLFEMTKLLKQGKIEEAVSFYQENEKWFNAHTEDAEVRHGVKILVSKLFVPYERHVEYIVKEVRSCTISTQDHTHWLATRDILKTAKTLYADLASKPFFGDDQYSPAPIKALTVLVKRIEDQYRKAAFIAFMNYAFCQDFSFFSCYPVSLEPNLFFKKYQAKISKWVNTFTFSDLQLFQNRYGQWLPDACIQALADHLFLLDKNLTVRPGLQGWMHSFALAQDLNLSENITSHLNIAFIHATAPLVFKRKLVSFPVAICKDLNVLTKVADKDFSYSGKKVREADVVVAVSVIASRCKRFVENCDEREYVNGIQVRKITSADFNAVTREVKGDLEAVEGEDDDDDKDLVDIAEEWLLGGAERGASSKRQAESLWFRVCDVQCEKTATVRYCIFDRASSRMFVDFVDIRSLSGFQVARSKNLKIVSGISFVPSGTVEQKVVVDFEKEPIEIPLSSIFADAVSDMSKWRTATIADIKHIMNKPIPSDTVPQRKFSVVLPSDKRFASVVSVEAGHHKGAGFYVDENLVLTSLQALGNRDLATICLWDGRTVQGTVIARDIRLGLGLVLVQERGKPVQLYKGQTLHAGSDVVALGFGEKSGPTALPGVVGAVRKYCVGEKGGGGSLVVQTDCPANNSVVGGPLFLGNMVIGANCGKQQEAEDGLSLAVHYSELFDFIRHAGFDCFTGEE